MCAKRPKPLRARAWARIKAFQGGWFFTLLVGIGSFGVSAFGLWYIIANYNNTNHPQLRTIDLSLSVFEWDSTLPSLMNAGKDVPVLWKVQNSGNEDAVEITLTLGKTDLDLKTLIR